MKALTLSAVLLLAVLLIACGSPETTSAPASTSPQQPTFAGTWAGEYMLSPSETGAEQLFFSATLVSEPTVDGNCTFSGTPAFATPSNVTNCFIADLSSGQGLIPCCAGTSPNVVVIGVNGPSTVLVLAEQGEFTYYGSGALELVDGLYQVNGFWQCLQVDLSGSFALTENGS